MVTDPPKNYPLPEISPLERFMVRDGMLLNAEGWKRTQEYHRQRQNLHYQSLFQPGIVRGLGVCAVTAPESIAAQYRDDRWVQIQPGIAIDVRGNPIIIDHPIEFRIASEATTEIIKVYLVISYVDPDTLHYQNHQDWAVETFRINEKNSPPDADEIELCRIMISVNTVQIQPAADVFDPDVNELDLRYRIPVKLRSPETIRIAQILQGNTEDFQIAENLSSLLNAVSVLHPRKISVEPLGEITLDSFTELRPDQQLSSVLIPEYCLLYARYSQIILWNDSQINNLKSHLDRGTVLLIEASSQDMQIDDMNSVIQELKQAIAELKLTNIQNIKQDLEAELLSCESELMERLEVAIQPVENLAKRLQNAVPYSGVVDRHHRLKTQPFLFSDLPVINNEEILIFNWGSVILSIGFLSSGWGVQDQISLSRESLRTAQEFGINILDFSYQKFWLSQLQLESSANSSSNSS
ncbi:MAG: hypothetical protein AAFO04_18375 [Cyanobacteria bacterium J06592_8]